MNRNFKKRVTAANKLAALINKKMSTETVTVDAREWDNEVLVTWEEGPFEWAVALTGGSCIFAGDTGRFSEKNPWFDQVSAIEAKAQVLFECQNSYSIYVGEG